MPRKLYVCGNRAPHLSGARNDPDQLSPSIAALPDDRFWACFERRYGANPDLASPSIRAYILPLLRADFRLVESYVCVCGDPLELPIAAVGAEGDSRYLPEQLSRWAAHCCVPSAIGGRGMGSEQASGGGDGGGEGEAAAHITGRVNGVVQGQGEGAGAGADAGASGFSEHWFTGISPEQGAEYWGTAHRIVLDYPKELQEYLAMDLPTLY
mmetsp:Transcript_23500/g.37715  ORF Transcript_23500/g.37715 Transcript_23500/m.37715 type:complete len:211 (-) Transcript_23500:405-1037(-)